MNSFGGRLSSCRAGSLSAVVLVLVCASTSCGDDRRLGVTMPATSLAATDASAPTVPALPPVIAAQPVPTVTLLSADFVEEARQSLIKDPAVITAIGPDFKVDHAEPVSSGTELGGIAFLVLTATPMALPIGTPSWKSSGEGQPVVDQLTEEITPPFSYFYVFLRLDLSVRYIIPVPDELGQHEADAN
jgi:hypothetical protein